MDIQGDVHKWVPTLHGQNSKKNHTAKILIIAEL